MPDNQNLTSPSGTLTQTPSEPGTVQTGSPTQSLEQELELYKRKFAASTTEAQRLHAENQRLELERQRLTAPPQVTQPPKSKKSLVQALVDEDEVAINEYHEGIINEAETRTLNRLGQAATQSQREVAFSQYIQSVPELADPNGAVYQRTLEKYNSIVNDPRYTFIDQSEIKYASGAVLKPSVFTVALNEVRAELNSTVAKTVPRASFVEPSRSFPGSAPGTSQPVDASEPVLTAAEEGFLRKTARFDKLSFEDARKKHWKYMDPAEKARRTAA